MQLISRKCHKLLENSINNRSKASINQIKLIINSKMQKNGKHVLRQCTFLFLVKRAAFCFQDVVSGVPKSQGSCESFLGALEGHPEMRFRVPATVLCCYLSLVVLSLSSLLLLLLVSLQVYIMSVGFIIIIAIIIIIVIIITILIQPFAHSAALT